MVLGQRPQTTGIYMDGPLEPVAARSAATLATNDTWMHSNGDHLVLTEDSMTAEAEDMCAAVLGASAGSAPSPHFVQSRMSRMGPPLSGKPCFQSNAQLVTRVNQLTRSASGGGEWKAGVAVEDDLRGESFSKGRETPSQPRSAAPLVPPPPSPPPSPGSKMRLIRKKGKEDTIEGSQREIAIQNAVDAAGHDGRLDLGEFCTLVRSMEKEDGEKLTDAQLREKFDQLDGDGSGTVEKAEFLDWLRAREVHWTELKDRAWTDGLKELSKAVGFAPKKPKKTTTDFAALVVEAQVEAKRRDLRWRGSKEVMCRRAISWTINLTLNALALLMSVIYAVKFGEVQTQRMIVSWLVAYGWTFAIVRQLARLASNPPCLAFAARPRPTPASPYPKNTRLTDRLILLASSVLSSSGLQVEPVQVFIIACAPCIFDDKTRCGRCCQRVRFVYNELCAP